MEARLSQRAPRTFNGPLEAGLRAVAILGAAHPRSFDLQRLVALDYLLVHTGDINGPESLHPPAPLQSAELLVRRDLVHRAIEIMMGRELIARDLSADGIAYRAGENATPFLEMLSTPYAKDLSARAQWLVRAVGDLDDEAFKLTMRRFFDEWVEEFQRAELSLGAES